MEKYKDPAFLFYPESFLVGTMDMTDEEVGRYIRLLCRQHQKGHIPERVMAKVTDEVREKFTKDKDGKYYNERLEHEIERRSKFVKSRRKNGGKGGRPKKGDTSTVSDWVSEVVPDELQEAFLEWVAMRAEKFGATIGTKGTVTRFYNQLKGLGRNAKKQKQILEQSVDNGWKGLYPLSDSNQQEGIRYKEFEKEDDSDKEYVPLPDDLEEQLGEALGYRKGGTK